MKKIVVNTLKVIISLLFGVAIFWYLYSHLDTKAIFTILGKGINYYWIILSMIIGLFSHIFRAYRWRLQLRTLGKDPSMRTLTNSIFGTYAVNLLIPRGGEVWRCTYIAQREKMSFAKVLGSVVSDRLSDTLSVLLLTATAFLLQMNVFIRFLGEFPSIKDGLWNILSSPWLYILIVFAVVILIWLFRRKTENRIVEKIKLMVENLWSGFKTVLNMKQKYRFILYTVAIWFCYFMQLYVCFFAFDFNTTYGLGLLAALTLFVMGSISMGLPVQGGLGPWHLAIIATLSLYGVGKTDAGAFALVAHGAQMVLIVILGIYTIFSIALERKKDSREIDKREVSPS